MGVREIPSTMKLDIPVTRSIGPGACISAGDVDMASPTAWASLPGRPRTSESRRPSFSVCNAPVTYPPSAWRVHHGTYIAFQLDTAAAAENAGFADGSKEKDAICKLKVHRYIGLVVESYAQPSDDNTRWLEELVVLFVGADPPEPQGTEQLYMPIAPLKARKYVGRDSPIQTKTIFPWTDLLQWTAFGACLQIQELHASRLNFDLDEDELDRCGQRFAADKSNMEASSPLVWAQPKVNALKPTLLPLPATVWCDIRPMKSVEYGKDPQKFVEEVWEVDGKIRQLQKAAAERESQRLAAEQESQQLRLRLAAEQKSQQLHLGSAAEQEEPMRE